MRLFKLLVGILLIPACTATGRVLWEMLRAIQPDNPQAYPNSFWWMMGGFILWVILYFIFQRPIRTYVLGHELTHALWASLFGARVSEIKVSKTGGHVRISRSNFLIALAPYFFPFYTFLSICAFGIAALFFDQRQYIPFWLGLIGLTWGFHVTFTLSTLGEHQTDVTEHGTIFSWVVIIFLNLVGIGLWIVAVTPIQFADLVHMMQYYLTEHYESIVRYVRMKANI